MIATATLRAARLQLIIPLLLLLIGTFGLRAQSVPWQIVGPYGGEVASITAIGNSIFASTWYNGVFKSTDNGDSWSQIPYRFRYARIKELVTHDSLLFAIGADLYRSGDQGETWVQIHLPRTATIDALCFIGDTIYGAAYKGEIYRSYDHGTTWNLVGHAPGESISLLEAHEGKLYFSADSGFYRSEDGGAHWNRVMVTETGIDVRAFAAHDSVMVLAISDDPTWYYINLYRSTDRGTTWHPADTGITAEGITSIFWDGSQFIATGGVYGGIFASPTGSAWQKVEGSFNDKINTVCITERAIFAGSTNDKKYNGGIYRSTDNGRIWKLVNNGFSSIGITDMVAQGGKLFTAGYNGMYISSNNGEEWIRPLNMARYENVQEVDTVKGGVLASTRWFANIDDTGRIYRTTDGGNSWNIVVTHIGHIRPIATLGDLVAAVIHIPDTSLAFSTPILSTSTDGGLTWSAHKPLPDTANTYNIQGLAFTGDTLWMLTNSAILRSLDTGATWKIIANDFADKKLHVLEKGSNALFIGTDHPPCIYRSTDNGDSWHQVYTWGDFYVPHISHFASRGTTIIASAQGGGMVYSTDNGETWKPFNNGLANINIEKVQFAGSTIFAMPIFGGIYRTTLPSSVPGTRETEEPATDRLYPNPCGASATVRYEVPASGGGASQVVIGILNTLGEPVRNVLSERQTPGTYQVNIDLAGLENGAYFYSLAIGEKCVVRPFRVMK